MSISLVYDGTTVSLDGERSPDSPIDINPITVSGVRRTYLGAAVAWSRYRKYSVAMTWTNIPDSVLGSLTGLSDSTDTVYGTGFDTNIFSSTNVNFKVDAQSWTIKESGLNAYTATLKLEQL